MTKYRHAARNVPWKSFHNSIISTATQTLKELDVPRCSFSQRTAGRWFVGIVITCKKEKKGCSNGEKYTFTQGFLQVLNIVSIDIYFQANIIVINEF